MSLLKIFFLTLFFFSTLAFGEQTTKGTLTLVDTKKQKVSYGEIYQFQLVLHPYTVNEYENEKFEESFLKFIHVHKVFSYKPSGNNVDALVVLFSGVLIEKFSNKSVRQWMGDQKIIPIEVRLPEVIGDPSIGKGFTLTPRQKNVKSKWIYVLLFVLFLFISYLLYRKYIKKEKRPSTWKLLKTDLESKNEKQQLETLFKERRFILKHKPDYMDFFEDIKSRQYSPSWKDSDVEHLNERKKKLLEELDDL